MLTSNIYGIDIAFNIHKNKILNLFMSNYVNSTNYNKFILDNKINSFSNSDMNKKNTDDKWQNFVLALRMQHLSSYANNQKIYNHNVSAEDLKTSFVKSEQQNKNIEKQVISNAQRTFEKNSYPKDIMIQDAFVKNNNSKDVRDLKLEFDSGDKKNITITMLQDPINKIEPLVKIDNLGLYTQQPLDNLKQNYAKEKGLENLTQEIKSKDKLGKILKAETASPEKLNERYKQNSEWIKKLATDFRQQLQEKYPNIYFPAFHPDFGGVDINIRFNKNGLQNAKFTSSSKELLNLLCANKNDFCKIFAKHLNAEEEQVQNLIDFYFQE